MITGMDRGVLYLDGKKITDSYLMEMGTFDKVKLTIYYEKAAVGLARIFFAHA